jgi:hypothetical protein
MQRFLGPDAFKDHNDFEQQLIACEICGTQRPFRDMNSIAVGYRFPGKVDQGHRQVWLQAYQCPDEQHYGCCHEHAMLAAIACLVLHIHEGPHNSAGDALEHELLVHIQQEVIKLVEMEKEDGPENDNEVEGE